MSTLSSEDKPADSSRRQRCRDLLSGLSVGALVVTAIGSVGAATLREPRSLEATSFNLVDANGTLRGRWAVVQGDAVLEMFDADEHKRLSMHVGDSAWIRLHYENQGIAMHLGQREIDQTSACLFMMGEGGRYGLALRATPDASLLSIKDSEERDRIVMACWPDDTARIELVDIANQKVWEAVAPGPDADAPARQRQ